jgi:maltose O-acetyltransferase
MSSKVKDLVKSIIGPPLSSAAWYAREAMYFAERRALLRKLGHCGPDLALSPPWDIRGEQHIFIGADVYIGPHVLMLADVGAEIHIGNKIMFGPQVKLIANDHRFDDPVRSIKDSGYSEEAGIWIGNDVWIGTGAIILKNVHIGDGSVVGAGSVVTKDVGGSEIWAGNPARKIKDRFAMCHST